MFYRGGYGDLGEGREIGSKRPRLLDQSPYYGASATSSYMYNPRPYSYIGQPPPFPVVRLRGLPFDCAEEDIAEFLHGIDIVDILFVQKDGKFSGEAYCVLAYSLQIDFALQRNRQNIGRRYVEVYRSKKEEYYKAIANQVTDRRSVSPSRSVSRARSYDDRKDLAEHTGILRMRGLPYSVTKDDIVDFFEEFEISETKIHIALKSGGRPTGDAYVEFANAEDSKAAMEKDRKTLGKRYVELFPSTSEEMDAAVSRGRKSSEDRKEPGEKGSTILRMRGLPYSAAVDDILDFFKDFELTEDAVHLASNYGGKGRATGEAFVEFANSEDANAAMAKDRMTLGSRYIELFQSSRDEMNKSISRGR